jgi:L,D-peptidoglycan transpeptidase YkuD (ErfK/YbiS/YcfS/YnhG family)
MICHYASVKEAGGSSEVALASIFTAYSDNSLALTQDRVPCALGKEGCAPAADKKEGDGKSPLGKWPIRFVYYRPDRITPPTTQLRLVPLSPAGGWCDDPNSPHYNQPVALPFAASHEKLWRDDQVYDLIAVLGYNDDPVVPGKGSAIFLHLARENYEGTEGCVALNREHMLQLLQEADAESYICITEAKDPR